jgi:hypothetical protein
MHRFRKNSMKTLKHNHRCLGARHGLSALFLFLAGASLAAMPHADSAQQVATQPDAGITMTGRCPNGDAFRLVAYDQEVEGLWKSFYDYQGPVGKGTVKTKTVPKVMASRVCIALAEIASDE